MASKAMIRQRSIRILQRGLRLLQDCKVPRFSCTGDPADLGRQQRGWAADQLEPLFTRVIEFLERNEQTLFGEDCCWDHPSSRLFRKYFALVYFEQISANGERADYQSTDDDVHELESRLIEFTGEIFSLMTEESYREFRNWLFHHYGCALAAEEGWQNQPGDLYGFVRFVVEITEYPKLAVDPRMLAFAETLGLRLLGERQNADYEILGIRLLHACMRYTYWNHCYTNNAEEILELALRITCRLSGRIDEELFDVFYYAVRSIRVPNRSVDDEVMRTFVSLLVQGRNDSAYMKTLIRILLLDIPEVEMHAWDCNKFTISGRETDAAGFRSYLSERYQQSAPPSDGVGIRFSIRWKLYIGNLMPKLVARMLQFPADTSFFLCCAMKATCILAWVVMFPIGQSLRRKYTRTAMWYGMFDELRTGLTNIRRILMDRRNTPNGFSRMALRTLSRLFQDILVMLRTIMAAAEILFNEYLMARLSALTRNRLWLNFIVKSLEVKVIGMEVMIQQVKDCFVEMAEMTDE